MSETPHTDEVDTFMSKAAEIARNPRYSIPTFLTVAAVVGGGAMISLGQGEQRKSNSELSVERAEQGAQYFKAIAEISEQPAILETASNVFDVQGIDLFGQTLEELEAIPEFESDYHENKELIDATLLESTKALAAKVFHEGDDIAITRLLTDNSESAIYITQFVTDTSSSLEASEWQTRLNTLAAQAPEAHIPDSTTELPTPTTR